MFKIEKLSAREILDSRGRPTLQATCCLAGGRTGTASVPSGASTGKAEALELRDGDLRRYRGLGCRRAVANVNDCLNKAFSGRSFASQAELDRTMLELDGTPNKSNLGANAILAVSLAFARASARQRGVPLYRHFSDLLASSLSRQVPDEEHTLTPALSLSERERENLPSPEESAAPDRPSAMSETAFALREPGSAGVPPASSPSVSLGADQVAGCHPHSPPRTAALPALSFKVTTLPRPTINLFSGGQHAGLQAPLQDVLVVPAAARSMDEALAMTFAIYQSAAELTLQKYGMRLLRADEGGLAPPFPNAEAMLEDAVAAIIAAGFKPGEDVALAVDVASSHFYQSGRYQLGAESLDSSGMIEQLACWTSQYPIVSVEDGLAEDDWPHWPELTQRLGRRALVVGDDFLCTNPDRIRRAIETRAANTLLLKVNQIGTLTEALEANRLARAAGWRVTISARSGETEDDWLADLAVGWAGDQIKIGSLTQSDRLSKYNRLLAIEAETGLPLVGWPKGNAL
ncbi:MAG: hypothetical protein HY674_08850 [Chloroflexi bacterium]|nr:hypothetical protein [Chloroflexota bacterium]